jgi:LPXTG-motif cell wall-anchored protein
MPTSSVLARPPVRRPRLRAGMNTAAAALASVALAAGVLVASPAAVAAAGDCRSLPVDADPILHSDVARERFSVDGTGVKVGVISNSYSSAGTAAVQADIAAGLLPGPGNPCGRLTPVSELFPSPASDDEGRAMAQLVHGVAPGAQLYFAPAQGDGTATTDQAAFIQAINALVDAGVDVIVDDISLYDEPVFQESLVSTRIGEIVAGGVTYLSAAANETVLAVDPLPGQNATPVNGWRTEAYRPTECSTEVQQQVAADLPEATYDCLDFHPGDEVDGSATIGAIPAELGAKDGAFTTAAMMQWGEPYGAATAEFEMALTVSQTSGTVEESEGTTVTCTEADPCTVTRFVEPYVLGDPLRLSDVTLPVLGEPTDVTEVEVSIVRITQRDKTSPVVDIHPPIAFMFPNNGPRWIAYAEYALSVGPDTVGRTVLGHNGAPAAITVAATGYQADDRIEAYSSLGPVRYTLQPQSGAPGPIAEPVSEHRPTLVSVDGVRQSVLLNYPVPGEPGVGYFYGTSAATPNAGAVVALALQLDPGLTPERIRAYLRDTATRLPAPYTDVSVEDSVGAGLVDALTLLETVAADLPPAPGPQPHRILAATGADGAPGALLAGMLLALAGLGLVLLRRRARSAG